MKIFKVYPYDRADKEIHISGPGIDLMIDYDDVDHNLVDAQLQILLEVLESEADLFLTSEKAYRTIQDCQDCQDSCVEICLRHYQERQAYNDKLNEEKKDD